MAKLMKVSNHPGDYVFRCPGCDNLHLISDQTSLTRGAKWDFDGNLESPTFSPSYLLWWDHPVTKKREKTCHSFIKNGSIQYLNDCSHSLAGQTVALPELDESKINA